MKATSQLEATLLSKILRNNKEICTNVAATSKVCTATMLMFVVAIQMDKCWIHHNGSMFVSSVMEVCVRILLTDEKEMMLPEIYLFTNKEVRALI